MSKLEIKTNEVLLNADEEWLHFADPYQIVTAERLEQVIPAIHEIEQQSKSTKWRNLDTKISPNS